MVQVIAKLGNPEGKLSEMLGLSLGQGIGNALTTHFANRSLESVMQDKSLEGAPTAKKLEAIRAALSPYGEKGQEIFKQRLEIEKLANPKPKGGVTAQPIPDDVNQKISHVLSQSQGMSADDLKNVMDSVGIPPVYSNGYIENRRRAQETGAEHDIKFHQESGEFEKGLRTHAETARRQLPLIESGIKSVKGGKIKPGSLANVFTLLGETGKKISNALLSGDQAALLASVPEFLEGRKEIFGVRLSDADLKLLADKLPDIGKSPEANLAILNLMKKAANRAIKLEKIGQDVLEKKGLPYRSGKLRPLGYEKEVMNAFEDFERNEKETFDQPPSPIENKGRVIEDGSGKRFKSNGLFWEPI